jgi:hypothetical protein
VIYVVGPESGPAKLLEHVVVFIGAPGRGEEADAVPTMLGSNVFQARHGEIECLFPRGLFQAPIPADQRSGEAVRAMDEFVGIPSFDAELAPIHGSSLQRHRSDQATVHNFEKHLAAAPAIRTGGRDKSIIHGGYKTPCQSSESEGHSLESASVSQQQTLSPSRVWFTLACCWGLCQLRHKGRRTTFPSSEALFGPEHAKDSKGQNRTKRSMFTQQEPRVRGTLGSLKIRHDRKIEFGSNCLSLLLTTPDHLTTLNVT